MRVIRERETETEKERERERERERDKLFETIGWKLNAMPIVPVLL